MIDAPSLAAFATAMDREARNAATAAKAIAKATPAGNDVTSRQSALEAAALVLASIASAARAAAASN